MFDDLKHISITNRKRSEKGQILFSQLCYNLPLHLHRAAGRRLSQPAGEGGAEPAGSSDGQHEGREQAQRRIRFSNQPVQHRQRGGGSVGVLLFYFNSLLLH